MYDAFHAKRRSLFNGPASYATQVRQYFLKQMISMCVFGVCVFYATQETGSFTNPMVTLLSYQEYPTKHIDCNKTIVDPKYWGVEKHRLGFSGSARSTPPSTLG